MTVRQANRPDANYIRLLLSQLGYPDFTEQDVEEKIKIHENAGYCMLVAEIGKEVIGFCSLHWFELAHWHEKLGRITSFCIDEKFRSQGIGQKLLQAAEDRLIKESCVKFEVTSNLRRTRAHEFYLRAGYTEDSRRFVKYCKL